MPLTLIALFVLGGLSFAQDTEAAPPWMLPVPSGPYSVGTAVFHLSMSRSGEISEAESSHPRKLTVQLWYPTQASEEKSTAPYIPDSSLLKAMKEEGYLNLNTEILESWRSVQTHAVPDAPLVESPQRLPLLLFSHGFGMSRSTYTSIVEDLASHGYVVATIDHPYSGLTVLPDGQVLPFTPHPEGPPGKVEEIRKDASFVLDVLLRGEGEVERFAGRMDPERLGMFGHSLGGAAALDACRADPRFQACVDLDGDPFGKVEEEGVAQPYLVILNVPEESHRPPPEIRAQRDSLWIAVVSKRTTPAFIVKIENTNHYSFSDLPFVVPDSLMRRNGAAIAPQRGFEILTQLIRSFFSHYLSEERKASPLDAVARMYPEVTLEAFGN